MKHVSVEALQLILDRVGSVAADQRAGVDQRGQQLPQRSPDLMTDALYRRRAIAARQVLVKEVPDDLVVKILRANSAPASPAGEVDDAAHVRVHRAVRIAPLEEAAHVGRYEGRQIAVAQPRCGHRMNGLERIQEALLKWGCHRRRRLLLCEVQTSIAAPVALTRFALLEGSNDKFA
ncbi:MULTISPECIES: hypothetical protein, partial [unclassified Methylibium]|uniref:hypothetical protein n=1 Tax=unclassified Methylibium TaxID=2633235 RepID=UPI001E38F4E8